MINTANRDLGDTKALYEYAFYKMLKCIKEKKKQSSLTTASVHVFQKSLYELEDDAIIYDDVFEMCMHTVISYTEELIRQLLDFYKIKYNYDNAVINTIENGKKIAYIFVWSFFSPLNSFKDNALLNKYDCFKFIALAEYGEDKYSLNQLCSLNTNTLGVEAEYISLQCFFTKFFESEYQRYKKYLKQFNEEAKRLIGYKTIVIPSESDLNDFRTKIEKELVSRDYFQNLKKQMAENQMDVIEYNFYERELYKAIIGNADFAISFISSEWYYNTHISSPVLEQTAIVAGYLKSIEQLLFTLVSNNVARLRNRLFTAITRSKAWVRVVGFGSNMTVLKDEIDKVKQHNYQLDFIYPTFEQRKKMNIVNRDMTPSEKNRVNKIRLDWNNIISDIESGRLFIEDLDKDAVEKMRNLLNSGDEIYDYVIMDEASQVDVATGALALSVAKNAVIVGDTKQLPNVITEETRKQADVIRRKYLMLEGYDYARNSFLQSVLSILPDAPVTLLREHYRCHPAIISFCNKKFYNDELIIMTKDDGKGNALKAIKTVEGNHSRGHYNQRQIDIIKNEILPTLDVPNDEIGIIAPYNDQVNELKKQIPGIDIATVHKFQGRERDVIILSTVDDQIGDFADDPNLLNVAVSRAKKQLYVVVSGNKQSGTGNILDLISYISYNNMEVTDSKVYSVFDYLYSQYREQRWKYLKGKKQISQYDSENLIYNLLLDILKDHSEYGVQCFTPLNMVVKDCSGLSEEEIRYLRNPNTHLDFMIYNKLSKQPVLAIEVDGYSFHKEGTDQHERDLKKNHILEVVGIPIVRLNTTGSGEAEKILKAIGIINH